MSMGIRRRRALSIQPDIAPAARRWVLRMLVPFGAHRDMVSSRGFSNDQVAHALGLSEWIDPEDRDFDPALVRARLRERH